MPISCFTTGSKYLLKSLEQTVSLGTVLVVFFLLMVSPIVGMSIHKSDINYENELCQSFGVDKAVNNTESSVIAFTVLALVCYVLATTSWWFAFKRNVSRLNYTTPLIIIIIAIISTVVAYTLSKADTTLVPDNTNVDPKIRKWCYSTNTYTSSLNTMLVGFLGIVIAIFVSWATSTIATTCEIY